ncbi:OmpA family protein [Pseudorhizobium pelagicum]|uniref:OmpA-like domain-containing protein n=1 Tax=Pseudorhizobium pelagicum TaxID=1509405 RepID=A0A922NZR8_9HYPH|nr:OmpA family protein [Pseudorhizobium pelagicum]KEQ04742.1 hypothetical protein GV68_12155 [Pseudorhizobium pelagicum]KEQ07343.1 hypothetical protein GV67_21380 [Pseudorhizobium pelagicum]
MVKFLALCAAAYAIGGSASAADIRLHLTGTELNGGPAFEILVDQEVVGKGTVDPIPAPGKYAEFTFQVPDEQLSDANQISVRMTNDAYEEGVGDRNLDVVSATVASVQLESTDFRIMRQGEDTGRSDGRLSANLDVAVAEAPSEGWFSDQSATNPAHSSSRNAECEALTVSVTGYSNGLATISDAQRALLAEFLGQKNCQIKVVGYSSTVGSEAANKRLASQRAEVVADYLVSAGVSRDRVLTLGEGETEQFGPAQGDNRRVVVSSAPL